MLSTFFQKAVALNHGRENPCRGIKRQQEPLKPVPFVALDAQERLIAEMPDSLRSLVALLLDTGLRLGEALRLEWCDVDFRRQIVTVRISKNKTGREVPFMSRSGRALEDAYEASDGPRVPDLVFPHLVEYAMSSEARLKTTARKAWNVGKKQVGLPSLTLHDLRHVWAVNCVRAGVSLGELRELGGWKSEKMVFRYTHLNPDHLAEAINSLPWEKSGSPESEVADVG